MVIAVGVGTALAVRELHVWRARVAESTKRRNEKWTRRTEHDNQKKLERLAEVAEGRALLEQSGLGREILIINPRLSTRSSELDGSPISVLAFSWLRANVDPEDPSQIQDSQVDLKVVIPNVDDGNDAPTISLQFRDFELYKGGRVRNSLEQGKPDLAVQFAYSATVNLSQEARDGLFPKPQ